MKKLILSLCSMILLMAAASEASATLLNGGFEVGSLSGWNVTLEGGRVYDIDGNYIDTIDQFPFSIFETDDYIMPKIESAGLYSPVDGNYYLSIPGTIPFTFEGTEYTAMCDPTSTISVSQDVFLNEGDILSGWAALWTSDYPSFNYDRATVEISNSIISDLAIQITVADALGEHWTDYHGEVGSSPWTYWTWTAPSDGMYTLSIKNYRDDQADSIAFFDDIQVNSVHGVPEPATWFFLASSLIGTLILGRKKFCD